MHACATLGLNTRKHNFMVYDNQPSQQEPLNGQWQLQHSLLNPNTVLFGFNSRVNHLMLMKYQATILHHPGPSKQCDTCCIGVVCHKLHLCGVTPAASVQHDTSCFCVLNTGVCVWHTM